MRRRATASSALPLGLGAALALAGCARPERVAAPEKAAPHVGAAWFDYRGQSLGVTAEQAKARDAALSEDHPPESGLDRVTAVEAGLVYRDICSSCHGAAGEPPERLPFAGAPPREWGTFGTRMGFFFGGDAMRTGLYRRIRDGGEAKEGVASNMPAWGGALSREQMWALVRHLETF